MKTLLIILVTLVISQHIYQQYGSNNLITKTTESCVSGIRWALHSADHLLK